ncbi:MAG: tetratricopeptide repeat protein [Phycisphaerales bacterium]|nr:tetratricopeptide repeat protein [Phycisphaerales bacterium]
MMNHRHLITFAATALSLAALASLAHAQVREIRGGNALDRNPLIGSGGSNQPIQGYVPAPFTLNPNDVIQGTTPGLSYFHDRTGTYSTLQSRAFLGTSTLNTFYRQSAPLSPAGGGSAYFLPSSMVSTWQGSLYSAPMGAGFESRLVPNVASPATPSSNTFGAVDSVGAGAPIRVFDRSASAPPLPGTPGAVLSTSFSTNLQLHGMNETSGNPTLQPLPSTTDTSLKSSVNDVRPDTGMLNPPNQTSPTLPNLDDATRVTGVFLTVQAALEKAQTEAFATDNTTSGSGTSDTGKTDKPQRVTSSTTSGMIDSVWYQSTDPTKPGYLPQALLIQRLKAIENQPDAVLRSGRELQPLKSLADPNATAGQVTPFDTQMRKAEALLKNEKYLDAADAYQSALIVEPNNPLALIGRANAEIGAGMYTSAAYDLKFVFTKKPELMALRFAIDEFIPAQRLSMILADLADMAKAPNTGNNASFLYSYLTYNTGRSNDLQTELDHWRTCPWRDTWQSVATKAWGPKNTLNSYHGGSKSPEGSK